MIPSRRRFYQEPPGSKSIEQCASHGDDHGSYGWGRQPDPRWGPEQAAAYHAAYDAARAARTASNDG